MLPDVSDLAGPEHLVCHVLVDHRFHCTSLPSLADENRDRQAIVNRSFLAHGAQIIVVKRRSARPEYFVCRVAHLPSIDEKRRDHVALVDER